MYIALLALSSCKHKSLSLKLIPVKSGDKWGYIDKQGKILINPQFNDAHFFLDGLALVRSSDDKYGYIGEGGKYVINPMYKDASSFSEGLACVVKENAKPEYVDACGKTQFVAEQAEICGAFKEDRAPVSIKGKWGFLDRSGKVAISPQFDAVMPFSDGLAGFCTKTNEDRKWGYIDQNGKIVIPAQFDHVGKFSEGVAAVYNGKSYGYIDQTGKYTVNPQFDAAGELKNGLALVKKGDSMDTWTRMASYYQPAVQGCTSI